MTDLRQTSYNKYEFLDQVPYKLIEYLVANNETIWKLLYDNSPDAWSISNLTTTQKTNLIYDGVRNETDCRVFLSYGQNDAWTEEITILRVSVLETLPTNYIYGHLLIGFEVYPHYKIETLNNYRVRSDMIIQQLIETFNGADVGTGIGRLYFDNNASQKSRTFLIGNAPFRGKGVVFCNYNF